MREREWVVHLAARLMRPRCIWKLTATSFNMYLIKSLLCHGCLRYLEVLWLGRFAQCKLLCAQMHLNSANACIALALSILTLQTLPQIQRVSATGMPIDMHALLELPRIVSQANGGISPAHCQELPTIHSGLPQLTQTRFSPWLIVTAPRILCNYGSFWVHTMVNGFSPASLACSTEKDH